MQRMPSAADNKKPAEAGFLWQQAGKAYSTTLVILVPCSDTPASRPALVST
ncbi:hypothetical protein CtesDRAFT_PD0951 [Comamonas testosteroni KF-1]|uniref:Uncharacterized protein n=1 Tax=Comamonas testosteroni (strain DSM 14576 / KF-1) TaxID=399795 RepID=B7WXI2_COMTK|nr:hypothetical protein CtesDRAFT_PD0951 [Comamonas testosteroni KF-1]